MGRCLSGDCHGISAGLVAGLHQRLADLTLRDERRLRRRLDGITATRDDARREALTWRIEADIAAAEARMVLRKAARPVPTYPNELPVSQRPGRDRAAIRDHQVVIVRQGRLRQDHPAAQDLPGAGTGVRGLIGHASRGGSPPGPSPRRIADELGATSAGRRLYQVRFTGRWATPPDRLMTDGILLAETQHDRLLTG
jgi:ATP-dependent helicase HrpA